MNRQELFVDVAVWHEEGGIVVGVSSDGLRVSISSLKLTKAEANSLARMLSAAIENIALAEEGDATMSLGAVTADRWVSEDSDS